MDLSKLTEAEIRTIEFYDQTGEQWSTDHSPNYWQEEFKMIQKLLPRGSILEVGCGDGRDAATFIENGYQYSGIDPSYQLLQVAISRNPKGIFKNETIYDLDFDENYFDGFWAAAVLLHIPKKRIDYALKRLSYCLHNKAVGFISIKRGDSEAIELENINGKSYPRFFAYYKESEFENILHKNGFNILHNDVKIFETPTRWLTYIVQLKK